MGAYVWMVIALAILFIMVMIMALISASPRISPDEEARLLAMQEKEKKEKLATKKRTCEQYNK